MKKNSRYIFLFFFLMIAQIGQSQRFSMHYWHKGEIDLLSEKTIAGKVKYDLKKESLQLIRGNFVRSYGARSVASFQIIDEIMKITRTFYALPFSEIDGYNNVHFFELLTEGKHLSLMAREELVRRYNNNPGASYAYGSNNPNNQNSRLELIYHYYIVNSKGEIRKLKQKKTEILTFMGSKKEQVQLFMKRNKLNSNERNDMIQIVDFYNSLRKD